MKRAKGERREGEAEGIVRRSQVGVYLSFSCRLSLMLVKFSGWKIRSDRGIHATLCIVGGGMGGGDRCGQGRDGKARSANSVTERF